MAVSNIKIVVKIRAPYQNIILPMLRRINYSVGFGLTFINEIFGVNPRFEKLIRRSIINFNNRIIDNAIKVVVPK